jgi:hypothetical protein
MSAAKANKDGGLTPAAAESICFQPDLAKNALYLTDLARFVYLMVDVREGASFPPSQRRGTLYPDAGLFLGVLRPSRLLPFCRLA